MLSFCNSPQRRQNRQRIGIFLAITGCGLAVLCSGTLWVNGGAAYEDKHCECTQHTACAYTIPSVEPLCIWLCPRAGWPGCSSGSHRSAGAHPAGGSTQCSPCHSQSPGTSSCCPSESGPGPIPLLVSGTPMHTCNVDQHAQHKLVQVSEQVLH